MREIRYTFKKVQDAVIVHADGTLAAIIESDYLRPTSIERESIESTLERAKSIFI